MFFLYTKEEEEKEEEIVACGRFLLYRLRVFGDVGIREAEVLGVIGTSVAPLFLLGGSMSLWVM